MRPATRQAPRHWRRRHRPSSGVGITVHLATRAAGAVSHGARHHPIPLGRAVDLGLMSEEGYLTPLGYAFWGRTDLSD